MTNCPQQQNMMSRNGKAMNPNHVTEEAIKWFVQRDAGEISPEKAAEFDEWMAESQEHRDAFADLQLDGLRIRLIGDIDRGSRTPERHADQSDSPVLIRIWVALPKWTLVVAAALGGFGLFSARAVREKTLQVVWQEYKTGVGEHRQVSFVDGTTAELNTDTSLHVSVTSGHREALLDQGEALFDVTRDPNHPFVVRARDSHVDALGTRFTVVSRPEHPLTTLVTDGQVEVCTPALEPRLVDANQMAKVTPQGVEVQVLKPGEVARRTAWLKGELRFDGQPLEEAVDEFNRYNEERLVIVDPRIRGIAVGGVYSASDPYTFARLIEHSLGVSHREAYAPDGRHILELTGHQE
jgi:transmembrane sensor